MTAHDRLLAARAIGAACDGLRASSSPYTVVTISNDGIAHPLHRFYDRLSSAVAQATLEADLYGVLAYSVRQNADHSFTVYGGPAPIVTMNRTVALND